MDLTQTARSEIIPQQEVPVLVVKVGWALGLAQQREVALLAATIKTMMPTTLQAHSTSEEEMLPDVCVDIDLIQQLHAIHATTTEPVLVLVPGIFVWMYLKIILSYFNLMLLKRVALSRAWFTSRDIVILSP